MLIQKIIFFMCSFYSLNLLASDETFSFSDDDYTHIGYLDLSGRTITDDDVIHKLSDYFLTQRGDGTIYTLAPVSEFIPLLRKNRNKISKLNLSNNQLSKKALEILFKELKEHKALTAISIADNDIGRGALDFAFGLHQNLPLLQDIDIRGNNEASCSSIDKFFQNITIKENNEIRKLTQEEKENFKRKIIWRYDPSRYDARNIQWKE